MRKSYISYNNQYQSNKMKQELKDEKKIKWLYENKLQSNWNRLCYISGLSFPYASPAGEVDGGLVEIR